MKKGSFSHYVDFKTYELNEGSVIFIAKNQIHHFSKEIYSAKGYCIIFKGLFGRMNYYLPDVLKLTRLFNYHLVTPRVTQN